MSNRATLSPSEAAAPAVTWRDRSGAWLGIGTAPGLLLLGAGVAARHQGAVPIIAPVLGLSLLAFLLWSQGHLGLNRPLGGGGPLAVVAQGLVDGVTQWLLGLLMFLAMLGWFGFNVGFGGWALHKLTGIPEALGPIALGLPIAVLSMGGMSRWNGLAFIATVATMLLVGISVWRLGAHASPLAWRVDHWPSILVDIGAIVGFGSVFAVRAPDFTTGLGTRRDLATLVALLCGSFLFVMLAGISVGMGTGSTDLVAVLAEGENLALGNLLIAVATIAPTFTTMYSGSMALRTVTDKVPVRYAMMGVAVIGILLGVLRFDLAFGSWLSVLGSSLPPVILPMAWESAARRRGYAPRCAPFWVWLPASLTAMALTLAGSPLSQLVGLSMALALTAAWRYLLSDRPAEGPRGFPTGVDHR